MKKTLNKIWLGQDGTALIVALLVMGVLIAISLALSSLILRETRIMANLLESGRAYYAAESGIEMALYNLENSLEGYETEDFVDLKIGDDFEAVGEYRVKNRCSAYPCFDDDVDVDTLPARELYDYLELNETITIPLFTLGEDGNPAPITDFTVEYYVNFDPKRDLKISSQDINFPGWDVLRWKVYGLTKDNLTSRRTETIGDFAGISTETYGGAVAEEGSDLLPQASYPAWLGTVSCSQVSTDADTDTESVSSGRYAGDTVICRGYGIPGTEKNIDEKREALTVQGFCTNTEAREYYDYSVDNKIDYEDVHSCYPIKTFIDTHELNYLTLTNLMNPLVFNNMAAAEEEALSRIYFRVEFYNDEKVVREFADITSNGYSGKSKQSINVKIRRDSFMPVFNFSLYSVDGDKEKTVLPSIGGRTGT